MGSVARALAVAAVLSAIAAVVFMTGRAGSGDRPARAAEQRLFAFEDASVVEDGPLGAPRLVELEPATFLPLPGRVMKLGEWPAGHVVGPDGRTLAMGGIDFGRIVLIDLMRLARTAVIPLVRRTSDDTFFEVDVVSWPRPRRLLALVEEAMSVHFDGPPPRLMLVDPLGRKVLRVRRLGRTVAAWEPAPGGRAVLLLSPVDRVGPARLAVVSPDGDVRTVTLTRIHAGRTLPGGTHRISRWPALVVDGRRAIVVGAFETAASVDLRTLAVSYHTIPRLMRPHLPVAPPDKTGSAGPEHALSRGASRLDDGRLIVTGRDKYPAAGGKARWVTRAATIVDTHRWRVTRVFRNIARLESAHGLLFASGGSVGRRRIGPALAVFRPDGTLVYRKDEPNLVWSLVAGRLVAGRPDGSRLAELNPMTGEAIRALHPESLWCCDVFAWTPPGGLGSTGAGR
jgi:hypothetical protein